MHEKARCTRGEERRRAVIPQALGRRQYLHAFEQSVEGLVIVCELVGSLERRFCAKALQHTAHAFLDGRVLHHHLHLLHHKRILHHLQSLLEHLWILHGAGHGSRRRGAVTLCCVARRAPAEHEEQADKRSPHRVPESRVGDPR